jgi:hypothetical protein
MNKSKCPHCGVKLGNFAYAEVCPFCFDDIEYNSKPLLSAPVANPQREKAPLIQLFRTVVRFVES